MTTAKCHFLCTLHDLEQFFFFFATDKKYKDPVMHIKNHRGLKVDGWKSMRTQILKKKGGISSSAVGGESVSSVPSDVYKGHAEECSHNWGRKNNFVILEGYKFLHKLRLTIVQRVVLWVRGLVWEGGLQRMTVKSNRGKNMHWGIRCGVQEKVLRSYVLLGLEVETVGRLGNW